MNIFGEGFPKEIIDQIEIRQKVYGYGYGENTFDRFEGSYVYTNAKTAWCKLVSSVDINNINLLNNSIIRDLGFKNGDQIARDFILFNGIDLLPPLTGIKAIFIFCFLIFPSELFLYLKSLHS